MLKARLTLPLVIAALLFAGAAAGQCKTFAKNSCMPKILPYIHNGQLNTTTLMAGEHAELQMTFYSGQEYRLMVCSQAVLGQVSFRILDINRKELYNSKNDNYAASWDFKVAATQQLYIEIEVPASDSPNQIVPSGCVSILVGFKQ